MSDEIVVDAKNFAAVFRARELKRAGALRGALVEAANEGVGIVTASINANVGRDTGGLVASVHVEKQGDAVEVVVDAPHAGVIELGARPHWAPLQPLIDWVRRHAASFNITVVPKKKFRKLSATIDPKYQGRRNAALARRKAAEDKSDALVEAIARGIQRKIADRGSPPHWFMKRSLPAMRDALANVIQRRRNGLP
jgi:hypothetical protein